MSMMLKRVTQALGRVAPVVTAIGFILGNIGLLAKRGLHPNLETAVGFLWIASDYALRQKSTHPVAAPRLNGAGIIAGSILLSLSGIHTNGIDWPRVRSPLGYIPAAAIVGFQREIRKVAVMAASGNAIVRACGRITRHPYTMAALINSYGVVELASSALHRQDRGLLEICAAYAVATVFLPFLDAGRNA